MYAWLNLTIVDFCCNKIHVNTRDIQTAATPGKHLDKVRSLFSETGPSSSSFLSTSSSPSPRRLATCINTSIGSRRFHLSVFIRQPMSTHGCCPLSPRSALSRVRDQWSCNYGIPNTRYPPASSRLVIGNRSNRNNVPSS